MTQEQAALRCVDVLNEMDELERTHAAYMKNFKLAREELRADLAMAREDIYQMRLDEVPE